MSKDRKHLVGLNISNIVVSTDHWSCFNGIDSHKAKGQIEGRSEKKKKMAKCVRGRVRRCLKGFSDRLSKKWPFYSPLDCRIAKISLSLHQLYLRSSL